LRGKKRKKRGKYGGCLKNMKTEGCAYRKTAVNCDYKEFMGGYSETSGRTMQRVNNLGGVCWRRARQVWGREWKVKVGGLSELFHWEGKGGLIEGKRGDRV